MNVFNLFPIPVAKFSLGREFTDFETAFCNSQAVHKNMGNTTSNDYYVLNHAHLASIKEFIDSSVDTYLKEIYAPRHGVKLRVTQSWFNYSKPGEWHHKHAHPNSFISGVLYMKAIKDLDKIHFYNESYSQIEIKTDNYNVYNSKSWWLPVETGELMIFQSSLQHSVEPVQGNDQRISLAFNTFPVGYVGEEKNLAALHL